MNEFVHLRSRGLQKTGFWGRKYNRRLLYLFVLGMVSLLDWLQGGGLRQTFMFYMLRDGAPVVDERMFSPLSSQEIEIRRYVKETLLGPISPEAKPLFSRDTRLRSLLYRDGVVYADLSETAALPLLEGPPLLGGDVFQSLCTLDEGIRRNFSTVQEVKVFINGHRVASSSKYL